MGKITKKSKPVFITEDGQEHEEKSEAVKHDLRLEVTKLVEADMPRDRIEREWVVDFILKHSPRLYQLLGKKS